MTYFKDIISQIEPKLNGSIMDDVVAVHKLYKDKIVSAGTGFESIPRFMLLSSLIERGYKPQTKSDGPDVIVEGKPDIEVKSGFAYTHNWFIHEGVIRYNSHCLYLVPDEVHKKIIDHPETQLVESCSAQGFTVAIIKKQT